MWSTFLVTDEEGRTVGPAAAASVGGPPPGGPAQGPVGLTNLMSGRSTFGGNKRRRTTSTGNAMSEAQEGKVTGFIPCQCVFSFRQYERTAELMEPINHTVAFPTEIREIGRAENKKLEQMKDFWCQKKSICERWNAVRIRR